jgi:hypothetical protein
VAAATPEPRLDVAPLDQRKEMIMAKSKSMKGSDGGRKLATDHGRGKKNTGGEPQKTRTVPRGSARRSGSSKKGS